MKTDTNCKITHSYASKSTHSSQISFCLNQIYFVHFLSKIPNLENLNAQSKLEKLGPARDMLGI